MKLSPPAKKPNQPVANGETVARTISLPKALAESVDEIVQADPELNFSLYLRQLIRADLSARTKTT